MYDSPTGQIVAACYLGKEEYCDYLFKDGIRGLFKEGASNVDYLTSSLYIWHFLDVVWHISVILIFFANIFATPKSLLSVHVSGVPSSYSKEE